MRKLLGFILLLEILLIAAPISAELYMKSEVYMESGGSIREPTVDDQMPHWSSLGKRAHEDWWFSGIVQGDNGNWYAFIVSFHYDNTYFVFSKIGRFEDYRREWTKEDFGILAVQKVGDTISLTHGPASASIIVPDRYNVTVEEETSLSLVFTSRGIPFWYARGGTAHYTFRSDISGIEDLSSIEGKIILSGQEIEVSGFGVYEHAWGHVYPQEHAHENWLPVNFDKLYVLVFKMEDRYGNNYEDGGIFLIEENRYVPIEDVEVEKLENENISVITTTSYGTLKMRGEFIGWMDNGHWRQYFFNGTFTYQNGTELALVNGTGWNEFRLRPTIIPTVLLSSKIFGLITLSVTLVYQAFKKTRRAGK